MKAFEVFNRNRAAPRVNGITRFDPLGSSEPSIRLMTIEPNAHTAPHNHTETEFWTVLAGWIVVSIERSDVRIDAGETILVSPLCRHAISAGAEGATIQTIYWHDTRRLDQALDAYGRMNAGEGAGTTHLLIPAMVTPNGPMHLGHASGPFLFADMLRRATELAGGDAAYAVGTLGHQEHIAVSAAKADLAYYELADRNTASIKESLDRLQIKVDVFLEPRPTERFLDIVLDLFERLCATGAVVEEERPVPVDASTGRFVVDAHVTGRCPHCGGHAFGLECEGCGAYLLDCDLIDPVNSAGAPLDKRPLKRLYLDLDRLRPHLERFRDTAVLSHQARGFVEAWLRRGLPKLCLTNVMTEGVPVPCAGYEDQRFMVCMEYVARHCLAVEDWAHRCGRSVRWDEVATDGRVDIDIFFGSDNAFGRLVTIPTITGAVGARKLVPRRAFMNHFLLLDGAKFSTSRNHAIWVNDAVNASNSDAVRTFLALCHPGSRQENFVVAEFESFLEHSWRGGLHRVVVALMHDISDRERVALPPVGTWGGDEIRFLKGLRVFDATLEFAFRPDVFSPRRATKALFDLVDQIELFNASCRPWPFDAPIDPDRRRTQIRLKVAAAVRLAVALAPIAPGFARQLGVALFGASPALSWLDRDILTCPKIAPSYSGLELAAAELLRTVSLQKPAEVTVQ